MTVQQPRPLLLQFRPWPLFRSIIVMDNTFLLPLCIFEGHYAQMMEWADNNLMKLNKGKCSVLPLRESTFLHLRSLLPSWLGSNYTEWDPVDNVLKMSSSFVFLVKSFHWCVCVWKGVTEKTQIALLGHAEWNTKAQQIQSQTLEIPAGCTANSSP